jgi:hypothetical protein
MQTLHLKILSLRASERYIVRRIVLSAEREVQPLLPGLALEITEIDDPSLIGKYSTSLVQPSLVIGEKTVCSGRMPSREEVTAWLQEEAGPGALHP